MRSIPRSSIPMLTLAALLWPAGDAGAGEPFLVADLGREPASSHPSEPTAMDGRLYFAAERQLSGRELWVSDGTAEGTRMVREIYPGESWGDPRELTVFAGRLWFSAVDPDHGEELWVSDGSEERTVLVRDLFAGLEWSSPRDLVTFDGKLYFAAFGDVHGRELWVSDGTPEGTRVLKDIEPEGSSDPLGLTVWGDRLLFTAETEALGREPWISDGTAEGTRLLLDVYPGSPSGRRDDKILGRGDRFYFEGLDEAGDGLFVSDGTPEGTSKLDLSAAGNPARPRLVGFAGEKLVFAGTWPDTGMWAGEDGVWERLLDLHLVEDAVAAGDELFLGAFDQDHGRELWRTDGTAAGTRLVADLVPGYESSTARPFFFKDGRLWLTTDFEQGLWILDEAGGTTRLATAVSRPERRLGRMWFEGYDAERGGELWSSDGTPEGTGLVRDVNDRGSLSWDLVNFLVPFGRRMFLFTDDELWWTDGSALGTSQVPGPEGVVHLALPGTNPRLGDRIFFVADVAGSGREIWWSDGGRIEQLADLTPGEADTPVLDLESTGRRLVFGTGDSEVVELWGSDGERVERLVRRHRGKSGGDRFGPEPSFSPIAEILPLGDATLAFLGWDLQDPVRQETLWRSDGTAAGTVRLPPVQRPFYTSATVAGDVVYYVQLTDLAGHELWRSDGTGAGTRRVAALPGGVRTTSGLQTVGEHVAFWAAGPGRGKLWLSDGTAAGTGPLLDEEARNVWAAGGRYFVEVVGAGTQRRLWQLDADTLALEAVIEIGWGDAVFPWGEVLYFSREGALWRTDGTAEGTVRLGGPAPWSASFQPAPTAGGLLYYQADDGVFGLEMWAVAPECIQSREVLCLGGHRFQARSRWRNPLGGSGAGSPAAVGDAAGTFSFFGEDFPEIALKVLDGRALNDHFWAISGAATDLEVDLRLFDVVTGEERRHFHPAGDVSTVADFAAFADAPAAPPGAAVSASVHHGISVETGRQAAGACEPGAATLCLAADRFAVTALRRSPTRPSRPVEARQIADAAGVFVFFGGDNVELLVKVLDGRVLNRHFWVYAGSLTDVPYRLKVTDTVTGAVRVYSNPAGRLGGFGDVRAFPHP